ncbi:rhomboid family intramembrane serine protease [Halomonas halocynthiae]|uniref:rhomboid family intramembrane serine protease n=1 Tax=Halomonas halocynthiae TaxID=176290 RepID=UPI0003F50C40|nr:rhomboid family intramembrane serine protease [Halomonas halocynthiae]
MYKILILPADVDVRELREALWAHHIGHQFTDDPQGQALWLADPDQQEVLKQLLIRWERGDALLVNHTVHSAPRSPAWRIPFRVAPATAVVISLSLVVFGLMGVLGDIVVSLLTIVPVELAAGSPVFGTLQESVSSGQIWRLFSPVFLHFGWMHLLFNMLWLWVFGSQIEQRQGSKHVVVLLLATAIGGNLAQYATGTVLFGGMSGVDFGLMAYVWLMSLRRPESGYFIPRMLVVLMLGWLVFAMTSVAGLFGLGNVANEAHLGGLVVGLALGWYHSRPGQRLR